MPKLEDQFTAYMRSCYQDRTLHPTQYVEVRQAFYSGALVTFQTVLGLSKTLDESSAEAALVELEREIIENAKPLPPR